MKVLVRSKIADGEVYLIPFIDLFTSDGQIVVTDIEDKKFYFPLNDYDFLVFSN